MLHPNSRMAVLFACGVSLAIGWAGCTKRTPPQSKTVPASQTDEDEEPPSHTPMQSIEEPEEPAGGPARLREPKQRPARPEAPAATADEDADDEGEDDDEPRDDDFDEGDDSVAAPPPAP